MKIVAVAFVAIVVAVAGTDHDDDGGHAATGSSKLLGKQICRCIMQKD